MITKNEGTKGKMKKTKTIYLLKEVLNYDHELRRLVVPLPARPVVKSHYSQPYSLPDAQHPQAG